MDLHDTYNKIAEEWHGEHQSDDWWTEGTDKFIAFLDEGDHVLDIGCGGGNKSKYMYEHGLRVTGFDFSENMVAIARREVPEGEFFVCDLKDVSSIPDEKYDGLFMQAVLLHIPKKDAAEVVQELADKMKPGGYFYIAVKQKREGGVDEEVKQEDNYGYPYERFFSYFSIDELEGFFTNAGMKIAFSDDAPKGDTNWIQVIGKKPSK